MLQKEGKFDILNYTPKKVISGKQNRKYAINTKEFDNHLLFSYKVNQYNNAQREHHLMIPRFISKSKETFEVLGLLQAEMGKTNNGCVVFANSEPKIINKILRWFEKEFDIPKNEWRWYIAINIKEDINVDYKKLIENKLINYWINKTSLRLEQSHPKKVTYRKVKHTKLKNANYGCLMIEFKRNLFSQIVKSFLKSVTYNLINENKENIRCFMKGIIAGEGTIECDKKSKKFRVHISAIDPKEKSIYVNLLGLLNIEAYNYPGDKIVISKRKNNVELLKQRLMTLHPRKYTKFLNMMKCYPDISKETNYFIKNKEPWNKISQEKINKIIQLFKKNPNNPCWKIAEEVGLSTIKVNRVLKENNLGKRVIKLPESKRKEIAQFSKENPKLTQKQIAEQFNIHESIVRRSCKKYKINRGNKSRCKIPEEKIQRIIEIYKQNPQVKFSEIINEIGVSGSVIKRVRRENSLMHLGYQHLVGCNNKNK